MKICSGMAPFVWCLIFLLFPLGYPMSKVLDWIVGHEEKHLSKAILVAFLKNQRHVLSPEEIKMSTGAINLMRRKVSTLTIKNFFYLREDDLFTEELAAEIRQKGYSRVPIFNSKDECIRVLITKSIFQGEHTGSRVVDCPFKLVNPVRVAESDSAYKALTRMKIQHTSILMVTGYAKDVIKEEKTNPVRGEFFGV